MHQLSRSAVTTAFDLLSAPEFYYENGKPFLTNGLFASVTHSGDISAIVYSDKPVGIDIEKVRTINYQRIATKLGFNATSVEDFFREWTKRESLCKLNGVRLNVQTEDNGTVRYFDFFKDYFFALAGEGEVLFSFVK